MINWQSLGIKIIAFILYSLGLVSSAYISGKFHERNSIQNKQKDAIIATQNKVIQAQRDADKITNDQMVKYQQSSTELKNKYNLIKVNYEKLKDSINHNNVISREFVRRMDEAANPTMSAVSIPSATVNDNSGNVEPYRVLIGTSANYEICNQQREQLIQLQEYIKVHIDHFNKTVDEINKQ